jgi:hypothetical protein
MKRFQSQANRRSNFDKNQQKLLLQSLCGWADDTKIEKYKEKLKAALDAEGITYTNRFYYLGYNPPLKFLTVEMKLSSCKVCLLIQLQNNKFEFHKKK